VPLSRFAHHAIAASLLITLASRSSAAVPSELLLPATTKGFISTHDVDEVRKKFNETQLGELVNDPVMKPFIEDFRRQIGSRLERAGRKLGVRWNDLEGVYGGEVALAMVQPKPEDKMSHATVLIVDITGKRKEADALLAKIDANQRANRAVRRVLRIGGIEVVNYTQLLRPGEAAPERSYHFISGEQLIASDDEATITAIIGRLDGRAKDMLASVRSFDETQQRCAKAAGGTRHHIRWFIEPFGYAEVSRAAQGGKRRRGTDILKILQTQGFAAVQGIGGHIFFATDNTEVLHRTYVYAPPVKRRPDDPVKEKYDLAMRMLDFPNSPAGSLNPAAWALPDVASYLSLNWRMQEAFKYSETLVDAIINDKGVFKDIWDNLKTDPNGPQIDIFRELVDHLGTRAALLSDVKIPVDVKSERLMALIEIKDPAIIARTLEKAFSNDPQAKAKVFRGVTIWEITQEQGLVEETELMIEGAGFVSTDAAAQQPAPQNNPAMLPNMAITTFHNHLIVSTHVDFVQELIDHDVGGPNLGTAPDYKRVQAALGQLGAANNSFEFFSRTDESYRATYELLKQGTLPEAETMLARLLNALTGPREEGAVRKQEFDGSKLPDFEQVKKYLGPGGLFAQTQDDGWWLVGCLLKKQ
jgi:hypothetical protein